MTGAYLVLSLIFFSILYGIQLHFNRSFLLKLVNITVLIFLSSAVYFTFETYKGWPTVEEQTARARVFSVVIITPEQGVHDGGIYYWALENNPEPTLVEKIFRYHTNMPLAPRSYFVKYTPQTEQVFSRARNALQEGSMVFIDPPKTDEENKSDEKGQGAPDSNNDNGTDSSQRGSDGGVSKNEDYDADRISIVTPDEFLPPKAGEQQ